MIRTQGPGYLTAVLGVHCSEMAVGERWRVV